MPTAFPCYNIQKRKFDMRYMSMKINETIRQRRIERNLTQEQVANYLGVTAPAVNKWEKGVSQTKGY